LLVVYLITCSSVLITCLLGNASTGRQFMTRPKYSCPRHNQNRKLISCWSVSWTCWTHHLHSWAVCGMLLCVQCITNWICLYIC